MKGRIYFRTSPSGSVSGVALLDTVDVPAITEDVFYEGDVLVYLQTTDSFGEKPNNWEQLPFRFLAFGGDFYYNLKSMHDVGEIVLAYYYTANDSDGSTPHLKDPTLPDYTFKYVVTGPDATTSAEEAGVDWKSHDETMNFLNRNYTVRRT